MAMIHLRTQSIVASGSARGLRVHSDESNTHHLAKIIKNTVEILESMDHFRGLRIELKVDAFMQATPISFDPELIALSFTHLLTKALEFGSLSYPICVEAKLVNEDASVVFGKQRFEKQRTESSSKPERTKYRAQQLAEDTRLIAVKKIAEAHGGRLESVVVGEEDSVRLTLTLPTTGRSR